MTVGLGGQPPRPGVAVSQHPGDERRHLAPAHLPPGRERQPVPRAAGHPQLERGSDTAPVQHRLSLDIHETVDWSLATHKQPTLAVDLHQLRICQRQPTHHKHHHVTAKHRQMGFKLPLRDPRHHPSRGQIPDRAHSLRGQTTQVPKHRNIASSQTHAGRTRRPSQEQRRLPARHRLLRRERRAIAGTDRYPVVGQTIDRRLEHTPNLHVSETPILQRRTHTRRELRQRIRLTPYGFALRGGRTPDGQQ